MSTLHDLAGATSKAKLGSSARFAKLKASLAHKEGVTDPGALAASFGRKKYGPSKMAHLAAAHR